MKATEIKMQIVKNLGNYETVRLEATFTIHDEPVEMAFSHARQELEQAFSNSYGSQAIEIKDKELLSLESPSLPRVCQALRSGRQTFESLKAHYNISDSVVNYLKDEKLIS